MKRISRLLMALVCLAFLCSCAAPALAPMATPQQGGDERLLSSVRTHYKNASLIISGVCAGSHIGAGGGVCYDVIISEVFAGAARVGDYVHCASREMIEGDEYVLFLSDGEDVHYAEDVTGYELLWDAPLHISGAYLLLDGKQLLMGQFRDELKSLNNTISVPTPVYYYDDIASLAQSVDEIFIGRVTSLLTSVEGHTAAMRDSGSVEKTQYDDMLVTIEAFGSISGALNYGQEVELIYYPRRVTDLLDAATLLPMRMPIGASSELKPGEVYLFFLIYGPDSKQPYMFFVNPVQGFVQLQGNDLSANAANKPLLPYTKLDSLATALQRSLMRADESAKDPPPILIIDE
ncbi:MAG: hypothetical protein LBS18_03915 [Clostridiales bacterium]|jgi:hypothetical protein|nr:hypothetical protein [Clostridiales bacterium]